MVAALGGATWRDNAVEPLPFPAHLNNSEGAKSLYEFCLEKRVPLHTVSLAAVPEVAISVASDCASVGGLPWHHAYNLMLYPLRLLWHAVSTGAAPAGQDKEWFLRTFANAPLEGQWPAELLRLGAASDIEPHLVGGVPPPACALLLAVLPKSAPLVRSRAQSAVTKAGGETHYLYDGEQLPAEPLRQLLLDAARSCGRVQREQTAQRRLDARKAAAGPAAPTLAATALAAATSRPPQNAAQPKPSTSSSDAPKIPVRPKMDAGRPSPDADRPNKGRQPKMDATRVTKSLRQLEGPNRQRWGTYVMAGAVEPRVSMVNRGYEARFAVETAEAALAASTDSRPVSAPSQR